ncbi:MAG: LysR family transcriptional regulator [Alphaproteobacteria bacterium]|nr:LysR family transcriptional regulator [Alphaproteobacteria bacterium]
MDRIAAMRVFVAVAEAGGFAAAARRLALSPPAATRAVAALEARIGTRLFERSTRVVRLSEAGRRYLADSKRILAEIEEADAAAAGAHGEPRGNLAITASVMFGRMIVTPVLLDFLAQFPQVNARIFLTDRIVDLIEEGLDVAVRIAHLQDSSLSAVRVGAVRRIVVASPAYLAAHGTPREPAAIRAHRTIGFAPVAAQRTWTFAQGRRSVTIDPPSQLFANTAEVAIAAARAGRGLARVLSYMVADDLRAGRLAIVLADYEQPAIPISLVHPAGRRASARVRAFIDFAAPRLRKNRAIN